MNNLLQKIDLIQQLTVASVKKKTEGSYISLMWDMLLPLLGFIIITFVFNNNLGKNIEYYQLYVLLGLIHLLFLIQSTRESMDVIIENSNIIKSVNFSKECLIISAVASKYIPFLLSWIIFFILMFVFKLNVLHILIFPVISAIEFLFVIGICLLVSPIVVFFRDFSRIWELLLKIAWFITPVFYALDPKNRLLYAINQINPLYHITTLSRNAYLYNTLPSLFYLIQILLFSSAIFFIGIWVFSSSKRRFVELV